MFYCDYLVNVSLSLVTMAEVIPNIALPYHIVLFTDDNFSHNKLFNLEVLALFFTVLILHS